MEWNLRAPFAFYRPKKREHAMGAAMPFSKYHADPDMMEAMRAAFYRVCDVLQLSCDREGPLTEVVVTKVVELAKAGVATGGAGCFARWCNGCFFIGRGHKSSIDCGEARSIALSPLTRAEIAKKHIVGGIHGILAAKDKSLEM
jgi:hypothetical protein